jgi:hypothetical protein
LGRGGEKDRRRNGVKNKRGEKGKRKEKGKGKGKIKEGQYSHFTFFIHFQHQGEAILTNAFLTRGARAGKAAPLKEPEPEPCRTCPSYCVS